MYKSVAGYPTVYKNGLGKLFLTMHGNRKVTRCEIKLILEKQKTPMFVHDFAPRFLQSINVLKIFCS